MPDFGVDFGAQLIASIDGMRAAYEREERRRQRMAQAVRQIPITANAPNAAGVIVPTETMRVRDGYYGSVRRLVLSGFTAGTAVVYRNANGGEVLVPFSSAATATFGRGEMLLNPGDSMWVQTTGITGTVQVNGALDLFEMAFLPDYIL